MKRFAQMSLGLAFVVLQLFAGVHAHAGAALDKLALDFQFYPSFSPDYELKFREDGKGAIVELIVFQEVDIPEKPLTEVFREKAAVDPAVWNELKRTLGTVDLKTMPAKREPGLDGITIACKWSANDGAERSFEFWSPDPKGDPRGHAMIKAVYDVAFASFKEPGSINFLESSSDYFSFGPPIKTVSLEPYRVKIYGLLSEGNRQDLDEFFRTIQPDSAVCLDLSNLSGIAQSLHSQFERFVRGHKKATWVPSEGVRSYLLSCGVGEKEMLAK